KEPAWRAAGSTAIEFADSSTRSRVDPERSRGAHSLGMTGRGPVSGFLPGVPYSHLNMAAAQSTVLDARGVDRTLRRMAAEIVELNDGTDDLVIVGIQRRGVQLAARIVATIE